MDLSRGDHKNTRTENIHLYSLKTVAGDERAFWNPGVGLWQLDDANGYANKLNHAERAQATTGALNAAKIIHNNYCNKAHKSPHSPFTGSHREKHNKIIKHLADSLYKAAWYGCSVEDENKDRHAANCVPTLEDLVSGDDVFVDTRNVRSDRGRLYLNVHEDMTHEYGSGVDTLTCRWTGKRSNHDPFLCYKYDVDRADGYMKSFGEPKGSDGWSPLALPFLSFTYPESQTIGSWKHMVFKNSDTRYGLDLIAAVPVGNNPRVAPVEGERPPLDPKKLDYGWWYTGEIDKSSVEVAEW